MAKTGTASDIKHNIRVTLAFGILAVSMLFIFTALYNVSKDNVISIGHLNSTQVAQDLEYYLVEEMDEIALAARTVEIMQEMKKADEDILDYLTFESRVVSETINENYTGIYGYVNGQYMDGSGWIPEKGYDPKERPWYQDAIEGNGEIVYVTPYIDSETGTVMMSICKMLSDGESVISLDVSLDRIQHIIEQEQFADYDQILITDKDNIVVASLSDESTLGLDLSSSPLIAAFASTPEEGGNGYFNYRSDDGVKYSVFPTEVRGQWNVFLAKKSSELASSLHGIYAIFIAAVFAFVVFIWFSFNYLIRRREAAESLNVQLESIAEIYVSVHKLDIEHDSFEVVRCLPYVEEQIQLAQKTEKTCQSTLVKVMKTLTNSEHWDSMKAFIDFQTLDDRMGNSKSIALEFLGVNGWTKARFITLEKKDGKISSVLWLIENIDEEKRKQSELRMLSETDLMTGVKNRGGGERSIKEMLRDEPSGMFCLVDVDRLKIVNDNYGHDVGDEVIKAAANCLKASFRASDVVLRLGGDEFAVFATGIETERQAGRIFDRLKSAVEEVEIPAFNGEHKIEISIGATFTSTGSLKDFDTLYKEADTAVYESKKIPGTRVTYYSADMNRPSNWH